VALIVFSLMFCACPAAALAQITHTVGPPSAGACGGSNCDYQSIQSAIDAAAAGDTVTAYRRTDDAANNECYNEHITINKANLTVQGASTTPASAACIGPSTQGDMVTITASGVTLKNLEISGKANDGAAGLSLSHVHLSSTSSKWSPNGYDNQEPGLYCGSGGAGGDTGAANVNASASPSSGLLIPRAANFSFDSITN